MFSSKNDNFSEFESDNSPGRYQILGGLIILLILLTISGGLFLAHKKNKISFFKNKKDNIVDLNSIDTDNDGLSDEIEKIYGTDINNFDTDGDGYGDLEEINNGYNPLGDGKLSEETKNRIEELKNEIIEKENNDSEMQIYKIIAESDCSEFSVEDGYYGRDQCYKAKAAVNSNSIYCYKISEGSIKDECFNVLAVNNNDEKYCDKLNDVVDKGECYKNIALKKGDVNICKKITGTEGGYWDDFSVAEIKKECTSGVAIQSNDYSLCNILEVIKWTNKSANQYEKNYNRYDCYASVAVNGNIGICDAMKNDYRNVFYPHYSENTLWNEEMINENIDSGIFSMESYNECLKNIAVYKKDESMCGEIVTRSISNRCYMNLAEQSNKYSLCENVQGEINNKYIKDDCYNSVAKNLGDINLCNLVVEKKDTCFSNVAKNTNDGSVCLKINSLSSRDSCLIEVVKKTDNANYCFDISSEYAHDNCIIEKLNNTNDISICDKMFVDLKKSACLSKLAVLKKDYNICNLENNKYSKDNCFSTYAKNYLNENICDYINGENTRNICYFEIADKLNKSEICSKITNMKGFEMEKKDLCYNKFAVRNIDHAQCEKIDSIYYSDSCYSYVALKKESADLCNKINDEKKRSDCLRLIK